MPNWKISDAALKLTYNILTANGNLTVPESREFPVAIRFLNSARFKELAPKAILGIAREGTASFSIYRQRDDDDVAFNFDSPQTTRVQDGGVLLIQTTIAAGNKTAAPAPLSYTFRAHEDQVRATLPPNLKWEFLLFRDQDGNYFLARRKSTDGGNVAACTNNGCYSNALSSEKYRECLNGGCYSPPPSTGDRWWSNV